MMTMMIMKHFGLILVFASVSSFQLRPFQKVIAESRQLNLFTNDERSAKKDDSVEVEIEEKELSSFFQGLGQWPLYPSSSVENSSNQDVENKKITLEKSSGRYRGQGGINTFSNLIKLEVILDLADGLKVNETEPYFASVIATADQLFKSPNNAKANVQEEEEDINLETTVEELIERKKWLEGLSPFEGMEVENKIARLSFTQSSSITSNSTQQSLGQAAEALMKNATSRIEYLVNEASKGLTPATVNDLIFRSAQLFLTNSTSVEQLTNEIVNVAASIAQQNGLDVTVATDRAREATKGASMMVNVANRLFASGYAYGSQSDAAGSEGSPLGVDLSSPDSRPLFADFHSARRVEPFEYKTVLIKGAEMGVLAGSIYEDTFTRCHEIGHSIVSNGTTADVAWMITDSIDYSTSFKEDSEFVEKEPILVRTITIRGFDASDSAVDRESLLNEICNAPGKPINAAKPNILFHSGLLEIATEIYKDVKNYIEWASPTHRIVFNGHSIGGSLSIFLLLLMTEDKGGKNDRVYGLLVEDLTKNVAVDFVKERVLRAYTHGSPPIAEFKGKVNKNSDSSEKVYCQVLESFGLPATIVFGYVQPYDPIVRFLSGEFDPLYPLVDDLGPDDVTLYASGPRRSLRPITRAIFQSWDGWPTFRQNWRGTNQRYQSVGVQHILLPEPLRYLNDRFISTNIGVPPTEAIVRISPNELLPALNATFPLDVFKISLIPEAVRSFLHHFYPAYDTTIANYAAKVERKVVEQQQ